MERTDGANATLARIMRTMDRTHASLLRSISYFEGSDIMVVASPEALQPVVGIRVGAKAGPASAAVVHEPSSGGGLARFHGRALLAYPVAAPFLA
jgi:hypothetical protein